MSDLDADVFTFRFGGLSLHEPYCLYASRSGQAVEKGWPVLSYRRMVTLVTWAQEQFGEENVGLTGAGIIGFMHERDAILFATFWNGVRVPTCSPDDASRSIMRVKTQ